MSSLRKAEMKRAYTEASKQLEVLRARWPKAFPAQGHEVRPLAYGISKAIAQELGWSPPYGRAVLEVWKRREAYCRSILCYTVRIGLDGSETGEPVSEKDKALARAQIEQRKARREREAKRQAARAEVTTVGANLVESQTGAPPMPQPARVCEAAATAGPG